MNELNPIMIIELIAGLFGIVFIAIVFVGIGADRTQRRHSR